MQLTDKYKHSDQSPQTASDSTPIHHINELPQTCTPGQTSEEREATEGHSEAVDPAKGVAWGIPAPGETTDTVLRLHVATVAHGPTEQEKSVKPQDRSAYTVVKLDILPKYVDKAVADPGFPIGGAPTL